MLTTAGKALFIYRTIFSVLETSMDPFKYKSAFQWFVKILQNLMFCVMFVKNSFGLQILL